MEKCFYMMVGFPGAGKSTWVSENIVDGLFKLSTDAIIEAHAKLVNSTYDQVFSVCIEKANEQFFKSLDDAFENDIPVLVDRTNLTVASRQKILDKVPYDYKKVAIVVTCSDDEWSRRLKSRVGKIIPDEVIADMKQRWQMPTKDEGFDFVVTVNSD